MSWKPFFESVCYAMTNFLICFLSYSKQLVSLQHRQCVIKDPKTQYYCNRSTNTNTTLLSALRLLICWYSLVWGWYYIRFSMIKFLSYSLCFLCVIISQRIHNLLLSKIEPIIVSILLWNHIHINSTWLKYHVYFLGNKFSRDLTIFTKSLTHSHLGHTCFPTNLQPHGGRNAGRAQQVPSRHLHTDRPFARLAVGKVSWNMVQT